MSVTDFRLLLQPAKKLFAHQLIKIRSWRVLDKGGHYLAWEAPEVLAKDVNEAFQTDEVQKLFSANHSKI